MQQQQQQKQKQNKFYKVEFVNKKDLKYYDIIKNSIAIIEKNLYSSKQDLHDDLKQLKQSYMYNFNVIVSEVIEY